MDTPNWINAAHQRLKQLAQEIDDWAPGVLYGALASMSLLPLVAAGGGSPLGAAQALAGVIGGVGANLVANQLEAWKGRTANPATGDAEQVLAKQLTEAAKTDTELRTSLDQLLQKLGALDLMVQQLAALQRDDALQTIERQLQLVGSTLSIGNTVNLNIQGSANNAIVTAGVNNQVFVVAAEAILRTLQTQALSPGELQAATERYLRYLWDRYSILDIKGIGMTDRVSLSLNLLDMYIPLKARIEVPKGETWAHDLRLAGRKLTAEETAVMGERVSTPLLLLDLLAEHPGLVILGDPGAGKTTFLKYLALQLAQGQAATPDLANRLPILIPLSAYANALVEAEIPLQAFLGEYYRRQGIADLQVTELLTAALASGRALLLFDGLDEVQAVAQRDKVVNRVESFFGYHRQRGNKFVLTSRIVGYRDVPLTAPGVQTCTLVDFDEDDMTDFVAKWCAVLEKAIKGDSIVSQKEAAAEKEELLDALRRNPGVRQLAANPLLLTILSLMKRQGVSLPERRVQLYDKYVETLLSSWNLARGLDRQHSARRLDVNEMLKVLAPLALWMQKTSPGQGVVKQQEARRQLIRIYRDRGDAAPEEAADQLLADARDYASLLLERGPGEYGFIHLTFMEYLAAIGVAQLGPQSVDPVVACLAQYIDHSNWREVILLTIGYLGIVQQRDPAADDVVAKLIDSGAGAPGVAVVLAGEAVADCWPGGVSAACQQHVVEALKKALHDDSHVAPVVRAHAGRVLAKLGDYRPGVSTIDGMEFCYVPAGPFLMGSQDDPQAYDDEKPQHPCEIPYPYWISRYPVTNAQFQAFVDAGGYANPGYWAEAIRHGVWQDGYVQRRIITDVKDGTLVFAPEREPDNRPRNFGEPYSLPNHPVVGVTWYEALAFTRWLTEQWRAARMIPASWAIHLPNEAEWEKAARGGIQIPTKRLIADFKTDIFATKADLIENEHPARYYPWGNEPDANHMSYRDTKINTTNAVGCFLSGASSYGAEEMSGNVWEWTRSLWGEDTTKPAFGYPYQAQDGREQLHAGYDVLRVVRGGAFRSGLNDVRCAVRFRDGPVNWDDDVGFRLVASPSSSDLYAAARRMGLWGLCPHSLLPP
jgi:formylglycine-generating enzyme required for sulfatase activity